MNPIKLAAITLVQRLLDQAERESLATATYTGRVQTPDQVTQNELATINEARRMVDEMEDRS